MPKSKILYLVIICFLSISSHLQAQQQETAQPIELPNFVIEGVEQMNVRGGIKQFPGKTGKLSQSELDSLNSLDKQQSLLLPIDQLPNDIFSKTMHAGFIKGEFGRFTSPSAEIGYAMDIKNYRLFANAGFDYSGDFVENAGYNSFFANISSDYVAPSKFWIFGGSKTRTSLKFNNSNYKLYGIETAPSRNAFDFGLKVDVDGKYDGVKFKTGTGFNSLQLHSDNGNVFDNNIFGYLEVRNYWKGLLLGIAADVDIHTVGNNATNLFQLGGLGTYKFGNYTLDAKGGFQFASNTMDISRGAFQMDANLEYRINRLFTLKSGLGTGLGKNSVRQLYNLNPYLASNLGIDFQHNIALIKSNLYYHPNENTNIAFGFNYRLASRLPVFVSDTAGNINTDYLKGNILRVTFEMFRQLADKDNITGSLIFNYGTLDENGSAVPYLIPLKATAKYQRMWAENFSTQIGLTFVSPVFTGMDETSELDSYIDLNFSSDYSVSDKLKVFVRMENLINSDIMIWEGYRERGLFASIGILWQF